MKKSQRRIHATLPALPVLPAVALAASLAVAPLAVPAQAQEADTTAAASVAAAQPAGATPLADAQAQTLEWELSKRALLWDSAVEGEGVSVVPVDESEPSNGSLKLTKATGWVNEDTKALSVQWTGQVTYTINGAQTITFKDFALEVDVEGAGKIMAVVSSADPNQAANNKEAKRVTVATFKGANVAVEGKMVTVGATPEYEGVVYKRDEDISYPDAWPTELVNNVTDSVRSWFYNSGSRWEDQKKPAPFAVTLELGEKPEKPAEPEPAPAPGQQPEGGIRDASINRDGHLILTFTNGATKDLGKVVGKDGKDGRNGADGKDGHDGRDGRDAPAGRDGKDGRDGAAGKDGTPGKDGAAGADGKDGRGIASVKTDKDGKLVVTLTDGTVLPPVEMPAAQQQGMAPESIVAIVLGVIATLLGGFAALHTLAASILPKI
ncbi:HtaA domain-containing protein [Corynebacterium sp. CCUG 18816]|uniref:HtaA domain-containing protein n=1 Tax=Corynebacterium pseudogenitalium TaxID=38303 RepID=UPI0021094A6B|nr:HtaA domain-containing protein [Corynebacterium pseudogenitalium]MCQ4615892.1 HtaA domain-containing protein [Corynebacterium pseudogenitalium]